MADEYKIGDVAKFLKKIRRKRRQKQDELEDTNPLALIFGKSPCSAYNQQHYQNYLSLSKEHNSTSEEQDDDDDDDKTTVFDKQEDGDVSHEESDEEDGEGDDGDEDHGDEEKEEMVGMDEEDPSTKDEPKLKEKKKKEKKQQSSIPRDKRTIFVGNISKETQKKALKKHFLEYGAIETVRMRSLAPAQQGMPQKVVGKTQDINSKRNSYNAYVVFTTVEAAQNAIEKNGTILEGHHLRVDLTVTDEKIQEGDPKKTVFLEVYLTVSTMRTSGDTLKTLVN
ncbi:putative nucleolar protein 12-like [Apostichopus japonicus]|uniref:Putative nucleolar protein 12-like n=1 Tax=Stichopus japonicus TaxID=307972 RepID=A0A2G8KVW2_STIJA|nr:putative nucleolar protein 12-like [Apostichopus japonicus]